MIAQELGGMLGVQLNPYAQNQSVRCPMHDDRVASMSISIPKGVWYCWGCGKGGSLLTLARFLGGDFDRTDLIVESAKHMEPEEELVDFREQYEAFSPIRPTTAEAITYARSKGIMYDTLEDFGIRHDGRGTLVMPYFDGDRVVALRYRASGGRKWYESGSERQIYNVNSVRGANTVVLCEGESDTHTMFDLFKRIHVDSCVVGGIAGANSSVQKWELWALDLMWADKVYIAFDADEAGDKGAERAITTLGGVARRLRPTKGSDWSDAIGAGEIPVLD
jgi:DNA primase